MVDGINRSISAMLCLHAFAHHTPTHDTTTPIPHILHTPTAGAGDVRHRLPLHAQAVGEGARRQGRRPATADAQGRPARAGGTRSRSHARSIPFFDGKRKTAPPGDSVLFCSVPCSQPSKSSTPEIQTQNQNRKCNQTLKTGGDPDPELAAAPERLPALPRVPRGGESVPGAGALRRRGALRPHRAEGAGGRVGGWAVVCVK